MSRIEDLIAFLEKDGGGVPCSRYGRNSSDCAPWAVAMLLIYEDANGESDVSDEEAVDYYMGLVVNDHDDVEELVWQHGHALEGTELEYLADEVRYVGSGTAQPLPGGRRPRR